MGQDDSCALALRKLGHQRLHIRSRSFAWGEESLADPNEMEIHPKETNLPLHKMNNLKAAALPGIKIEDPVEREAASRAWFENERKYRDAVSANRSRRMKGLPLIPQPERTPQPLFPFAYDKDGTYEGMLRDISDCPEGCVVKWQKPGQTASAKNAMTKYHDTADGAIQFLMDESTLDLRGAKGRPDPQVQGVWEITLKDGTRAIVYLAGYREPSGQTRKTKDPCHLGSGS
jgi:hypothetical protein